MFPSHDHDPAKGLNPLSIEQINDAVESLNYFYNEGYMQRDTFDLFQKLITNYELYEHFHTVVGGWEGLEMLRGGSVAKSVTDAIIHFAEQNKQTDTTIRECEGMCFNPKEEIE